MNGPGAIARVRKQPILNPRRGYRKGLGKLGAIVRGHSREDRTVSLLNLPSGSFI